MIINEEKNSVNGYDILFKLDIGSGWHSIYFHMLYDSFTTNNHLQIHFLF